MKILSNVLAAALILFSFYCFSIEKPALNPDFLQSNHTLIAVISLSVAVVIGLLNFQPGKK
jgi:hypothetical protein